MNRSFAIALVLSLASAAVSQPPLELAPEVIAAEDARIAVIQKLSRSTVAIFESTGSNGGSGVVISEDGLVVTNFHVTAPCGAKMLVGMSDGSLHEAVLLGLDPTGDIALIQLLGEGPFPAAEIGDSNLVRVSDTAIVAGNPFLVAEDFSPTITVGVISGVHRYQFPAGSILEYADCLQTDAAINPGNSGGPLFDGGGRLIGINGRGSFEKRGRVNVGVGYAVSINQVMRFVSHLKTGRIVDHATLGATVVTRSGPQSIVRAIERSSDAYRRGLRPGDEVVSLDGRDTPTANALLNAIGVLPAGWRSQLEYRRDGRLYRRSVRLGPLHSPGELEEVVKGGEAGEGKEEEDESPAPPVDLPSDVYQEKAGYANHAAMQRETDRLIALCESKNAAAPVARSTYENEKGESEKDETVTLEVSTSGAAWLSKSGEYRCDATRELASQAAPPEAPAMLGALWVWSRLVAGEAGVLDEVEAFGRVPWRAGEAAQDVLVVTHRGLRVEVYFDAETGEPLGLEASRDAAEDAVRIEFGSGANGSQTLPSELTIHNGGRLIADLHQDDTPADNTPAGNRKR